MITNTLVPETNLPTELKTKKHIPKAHPSCYEIWTHQLMLPQ